ncbi:MAG: PDZ domain-containing protein [Polaribacter sp.]
MGTTIHGIIGYNLLRNFVVKINYRTKRIHFYNPKKYQIKKCRRCEILPIQFHLKKPYIDVNIQLDTVGYKLTKVKMLVDSGGSDAIWLFQNSKKNIKTPKLFFNDILGEGLSGTIYGKRSRIPKLKIGKFEIEEPTVSFLDSASTRNARTFKQRNGSIGGSVLKRFKVWLDYRNRKIMLKKKVSFKDGFNYNMSGLDVVYNGKQLVREKTTNKILDSGNRDINKNNTISFVTNFFYKFKPSYKIKTVILNSPTGKAGLKAGDIILKINRKPAYSFTLSEIFYKFQEKNNKKISITIERNKLVKTYKFRLRKRI